MSLFWFVAPADHNRIPNVVLQPSILARVRWAGGPFTASDISDQLTPIAIIIR